MEGISHLKQKGPKSEQVCCRRRVDQGSSLRLREEATICREEVTSSGGSHWFPWKHRSQPLWLTIIMKADVSLNRNSMWSCSLKSEQSPPPADGQAYSCELGIGEGRDPAGHVQRVREQPSSVAQAIQQVRLIILSRHLRHRFVIKSGLRIRPKGKRIKGKWNLNKSYKNERKKKNEDFFGTVSLCTPELLSWSNSQASKRSSLS